METKTALRQKINLLASQISAEECEKWSVQIREKIEKLPEFQKANTILFFAGKPDEVNLSPLAEKYLKTKKIIFPRITENKLVLHQILNLSDLSSGFANILEPVDNSAVIESSKLDLAIVPALAVTEKGDRLGRGRGFYDRLLVNISAPKICPVFSFQILDSLPIDSHDQKMDLVITEKT